MLKDERLNNMKRAKNHNIINSIIISIAIIIVLILVTNWPVIYQKGNPLPYFKAILQLNANKTYVQVQQNDDSTIFVTKRNNYDEFHKYVEGNYDVSFNEQMGSGYIFRSDKKVVVVSSEVYWKYYIIWTISIKES